MTEPFRIAFVPGVTPDKWVRTWTQRMPETPLEAAPVEEAEQIDALRAGTVSMCFVRLPVDRAGLHVIPLYSEVPVAVVAREHPVAAFDEVDVADLADESLLQPPATVPEWVAVAGRELVERAEALPEMTVKQAISVVAAGSGMVVVPMSVARLHHRKDVVARPVTGVAESHVGLAWRVEDDDPRIEAFIGVVRGRTARSTRGGGPEPEATPRRADGAPKPGSSRPGKPSGQPSGKQSGGRRGTSGGNRPRRRGRR